VGVLFLLFAGLVDAGATAATRARVHEARNRLGLAVPEKPGLDMRAKIVQVLERTEEDPFVQHAFLDLLQHNGLLGVRTPACIPFDPGQVRWKKALLGPALSQDWLPPIGAHLPDQAREIFVPWLGREVKREVDDQMGTGSRVDRWRHLHGALIPSDVLPVAFRNLVSYLQDWWRAEHPNLFAYTWREAVAASDAWHQQFRGQALAGGPAFPGIPVTRWPDGARIERLVTRRQLESEGASMEHCVGGHWDSVRDGLGLVFSYRDAGGIPRATWEIIWSIHPSEPDAVIWRVVDLEGPGNGLVQDLGVARRVVAFIVDVIGANLFSWLRPKALPKSIFPEGALLYRDYFPQGVPLGEAVVLTGPWTAMSREETPGACPIEEEPSGHNARAFEEGRRLRARGEDLVARDALELLDAEEKQEWSDIQWWSLRSQEEMQHALAQPVIVLNAVLQSGLFHVPSSGPWSRSDPWTVGFWFYRDYTPGMPASGALLRRWATDGVLTWGWFDSSRESDFQTQWAEPGVDLVTWLWRLGLVHPVDEWLAPFAAAVGENVLPKDVILDIDVRRFTQTAMDAGVVDMDTDLRRLLAGRAR